MTATPKQDQQRAWNIRNDGQSPIVELRIRLTPKSSRDSVDGLSETPDGIAIKARVRAIPENGGANKALISMIAKWLRVPKSSIALSAGAKSRTKQLSVSCSLDDVERVTCQINQLN
jgi:uncharacterized protein YggU (UPF0235/DUF167 family)